MISNVNMFSLKQIPNVSNLNGKVAFFYIKHVWLTKNDLHQ